MAPLFFLPEQLSNYCEEKLSFLKWYWKKVFKTCFFVKKCHTEGKINSLNIKGNLLNVKRCFTISKEVNKSEL